MIMKDLNSFTIVPYYVKSNCAYGLLLFQNHITGIFARYITLFLIQSKFIIPRLRSASPKPR